MKARIGHCISPLPFLVLIAVLLAGCREECCGVWTEDEIVGYRLELVSEKDVEALSFAKREDGDKTVTCVYGKKGGALCAPVELWLIDENGVLYIYPEDSAMPRLKISKLAINAENGLV